MANRFAVVRQGAVPRVSAVARAHVLRGALMGTTAIVGVSLAAPLAAQVSGPDTVSDQRGSNGVSGSPTPTVAASPSRT